MNGIRHCTKLFSTSTQKKIRSTANIISRMPPDTSMNEAQRLAATCTATNVDDDRHDDADRQYLFIIRHGDRWDYSYPEWKKLPTSRLGDSPLSPLGHQQARQVGEFLDEYLHARGLTHDIAWLSSPFLRCLQTSNEALNAMKIANAHYEGSAFREIPIFPEYSIFEWDGHQGEWHSDLPPLEERKHYFPRLDMEYEGFFTPELPEPRSVFFDRCQRVADSFHERFVFKPKQVVCMVSHAAGCLAMAKTFSKKELSEITPAGPCSIYMFTRDSDTTTWTLEDHDAPNSMNGYTDHLTEMGNATEPWSNFGDGVTKFYTGPPDSRFHPDRL